jgi:hypothetical protein
MLTPRARSLSRPTAPFCVLILAACLPACKWITTNVQPNPPKQGDDIAVTITAGEPENVSTVQYKVNDVTGTVSTVPYTVTLNTCKSSGKYTTQLSVWGQVTYKDRTVRTTSRLYDLTVVAPSRHNPPFTYVFYLSSSNDAWMNDGMSGANAFIDEFDSRSDYRYFWSDPSCYSSSCGDCASNFDLVISWGHGSHHTFYSSATAVDLSGTSYGGAAFCNSTGEPRYLAFASCDILSMDDWGSHPFWYYWFNDSSTKLQKRPFQGLHVLMGFRTLMVIDEWSFLWWSGNNADDFFGNFANKLDDGWAVKDAWLYAVDDELSFDDGNNRGAVLYHDAFANDLITTVDSDFIFGNGNYYGQTIEYWE